METNPEVLAEALVSIARILSVTAIAALLIWKGETVMTQVNSFAETLKSILKRK